MSKKEYLEESFPKRLQKTSSEHNAVNPKKIVQKRTAYFLGSRKSYKKASDAFSMFWMLFAMFWMLLAMFWMLLAMTPTGI